MPAPKKTEVNNRPYVENYPPLKEWLDKHEGRCLWQLPLGDPKHPRAYVELWLFYDRRGTTQQALIQITADQMGWNIFTGADTSDIVKTLKDAEARLGLT